MTELWYKKLGFYNNPFSIKPAAFDNDVVAYDMSYIHKKIDKGELLFLEGEYGTGKTTILKNIIGNFRGKNRIIYFSFNGGKEFNMESLLDGANSFFRKITGLQVKDIIMLLDEVHTMKKNEVTNLLRYYRDGTLKSIIFVTHDYDKVSFPDEVGELLNGNIIRTVNLSNAEAIEFVRSRIGHISLLHDKVITRLFKLANKNPRKLLEYCEDVSRYAVEIGDDTVTDFHIDEILEKIIQKQKKPEKRVKKAKTAKPEKVTVEEKKESEIDIKEVEDKQLTKKYKVNKLVEDSKTHPLGAVEMKEKPDDEEELPEYKFFVFDQE